MKTFRSPCLTLFDSNFSDIGNVDIKLILMSRLKQGFKQNNHFHMTINPYSEYYKS